MQCYYVTGQADFVMVLTSRSMEAYDAFVERFLFSNRNVRRFETMVVMDRVKVGFDLPMDSGRPIRPFCKISSHLGQQDGIFSRAVGRLLGPVRRRAGPPTKGAT